MDKWIIWILGACILLWTLAVSDGLLRLISWGFWGVFTFILAYSFWLEYTERTIQTESYFTKSFFLYLALFTLNVVASATVVLATLPGPISLGLLVGIALLMVYRRVLIALRPRHRFSRE